MKKVFLSLMLLVSSFAAAQGGFYSDKALGKGPSGNLVALPGAAIKVCLDSGCASPVTLYSNADLAIGHSLGTTANADANGNFGFYVAPGQYFCQVSATGFGTTTSACQVSFTLTNNQLIFTHNGIFTNTQMNAMASSSINGINFSTEYQAAQGANFSTEGFAGGVAVPVSSTVHQADGIAGYTNNSSTSTNAVGVYSQARCLLTGTSCWGANLVSTDVAGQTGITLYGNEVDTGPQNALGSYAGVTGVSSNLTGSLGGSGSVGVAFIATSNTAGRLWNHGFETKDAMVNTAFLNGTTCTVGDCGSQATQLRAFHSGSLVVSSYAIDTDGNWIFTLPAGKSLFNGSAQLTQIAATGTATVDLASVASGACTADSADVTLTGASVGDPVRVGTATALPAGVWLIGRVTATNTGRFQLCNLSGGAVDRASDTYTISVVK